MASPHADKFRLDSLLKNNMHVSFLKHFNDLILVKLIIPGFYIFYPVELF